MSEITGREPGQRTTKREQIADALRELIRDGTYAPGEQMPTVAELRSTHKATIATVQDAMRMLRQEGLVEGGGQGRRPIVARQRRLIARSAAYVTPRPDGKPVTWKSQLAALGLRGQQALGRVGEIGAPADVAELFGLDMGDPVVVRSRVMLADGEPVEVADTFYRREFASGTPLAQPGLIRAGLVQELLREAGLEVTACFEELSFPRADAEACRRLQVDRDARLVRLVRATHAGDQVVMVDVATLLAERYTLSYELPVR